MSERIDRLLDQLAEVRELERTTYADSAGLGAHCLDLERTLALAEGSTPTSSEEDHLAGCRACTGRLAAMRRALALALAPGLGSRRQGGGGASRFPRSFALVASGLLAAAILLLLFGQLWPDRRSRLGGEVELAVASRVEDLFREPRSGSEGPQVFLGIALEEAAYLRLLLLDDRGDLHLASLTPAGGTSLHLDAGLDHRLGGFAREWGEPPRQLVAFAILLSDEPLQEARTRRAAESLTPWPADATQKLERQLTALLGARILVRRVP